MQSQLIRPSFDFEHLCIERWQASNVFQSPLRFNIRQYQILLNYHTLARERERDRQTDRQAHRQTDRHTERQTDRQTNTQTNRQTESEGGRKGGQET